MDSPKFGAVDIAKALNVNAKSWAYKFGTSAC